MQTMQSHRREHAKAFSLARFQDEIREWVGLE